MSRLEHSFDAQKFFKACQLDPGLADGLSRCDDYRELLRLLFAAKKALNPKFSFALLAKRSGFIARGFISDVIAGKRRLTGRSLPRVVKGLGLAEDLNVLLCLQVAIQEPDINYKDCSHSQLTRMLRKQRLKISSEILALPSSKARFSPFRNMAAPRVYAALGDLDHGASLAEIEMKTGFHRERIQSALDDLITLQMVAEVPSSDRYRVTAYDIYIQESEAAGAFKTYYANLLREKSTEAFSANFDSPHRLHWLSHVSVRSEDLPRLKDELRNFLKSYVESIEDSTGDKIVDLCVSFT
ncbi:MAG: TIGR02147 family protein [Proteobacteria bacterium]|nr:TIGR02147 family protein [Pseudomonadota bacterium]